MLRSIALAVPSFPALDDAARSAAAAGLDRVWTTELRGRDAVTRALHVAAVAPRLRVGTGIAYAFTRHPLALVASAVEGQAATDGRLTVGVGSGTAHTRGEFGIEFEHPAPRLAEYVELMRRALDADGSLTFHGRFYDVEMAGFRFDHPRELLESVRIYGAALLPIALKALAGSCDGITLHPFGHVERYLDDTVLPAVVAGSERRQRPRPDIAAWMIACASDDAAEARALARAQVALYTAQPAFASFFDGTDWAEVAASIRTQAQLGSGSRPWREIGGLVPDEMLDALCAAGSPAHVAELVAAKEAQLARQGVGELTVQIPGVALKPEKVDAVLKSTIAAMARS